LKFFVGVLHAIPPSILLWAAMILIMVYW